MADPDPNLPPSDPAPAPRPSPVVTPDGRMSRPVCEFCECKLTHVGEIIGMSDKARGFRASTEKIEALNATIAKLETEVRELRAQLAPRAAGRPDLSL